MVCGISVARSGVIAGAHQWHRHGVSIMARNGSAQRCIGIIGEIIKRHGIIIIVMASMKSGISEEAWREISA